METEEAILPPFCFASDVVREEATKLADGGGDLRGGGCGGCHDGVRERGHILMMGRTEPRP